MTFLKALTAKLCFASFLFLFTLLNNPVKAQTTLVAGDIAFTGYVSSHATADAFSFVILTNITPGTVINFTDNGWLSTNVFRSGEQTVTWTSSTALPAGTEIMIAGPAAGAATATLVGGGVTGVCTGTMPSLSINGDQVLAYQGTVASPTFISAIHMNVYTTLIGDPVTTTAAAWDGTANTTNSSALPTGLTNGTNAIWIGTQDVTLSEEDNGRFNCTGPLSTAAQVRAAVNNLANWTTEDGGPTIVIPTGCSYIVALPAPSFTTHPSNSTVCEGTGTSFTIVATGAISYQWQVDQGSGFTNLSNNATYAGVTATTLNITSVTNAMNGYLYRCIATNGTGSTNSNNATLTVTPLPVNPTLLAKTPAAPTVADGTPVSATFTTGSGGTGCSEDYRYTTDGGATYLPYTPGSNISTTGLAAGSGFVFIEGRRANCSSSCQNNYVVLASWSVTPLPASATTLNAGDIAFSGYHGFGASASTDEFSFVLLKNIGPNTVINFTNNGWLSTNVFRSGEETVTWTSSTALVAGTEIKIAGTVATKSGGGAAGSVVGTALSLSANGDQILAYRGTVASPTFISAIHMNVYSVANGDPTTTTAAAWDGAANTVNASALPTGLTTGVNAIWIGTSGDINSEFDNAIYGTCSLPATLGSISALRTALNNQANWSRSNGDPTGFTLPTGCNYLSALVPSINVTGTPLTAFAGCAGTPSAEQNFSVSGSALTSNIDINAPAGFEISLTSGSGFAASLSLTPSGGAVPATTIYVRTTAAATGSPTGNITVASAGVTTINVAVSATINQAPTTASAGSDASICSLTTTLAGNTPVNGTGTWSQVAGPGTSVFTNANLSTSGVTVSSQGIYTFRWTIATGAPCADSQDDVIITFAEAPTVADAGADRNLCLPNSALNMAANTPSSGTGTWTQTGGPITATITNVNNPLTSITGMTTAGTYTFVWTITNTPCPASMDEMTITVAAPPAGFNVVGADACQGTTVTLTGPAGANITYTWQRSLSGITGSYSTFGGTAQTQAVTSSGNYQLTITNLAGCSASDTAVVHIADYVFNGSIAAGDPSQTGRINRLAQTSVCPGPKTFPGMFTTAGARLYDSYTITNIRSVSVCATIGIASGCGTNIFNVAYTGSFNPADPSQNYLGDPGSSFPSSGFMEVTIPANGTIVVVVHEVNSGSGCASYKLTVDVPRDPAGITVTPTPPVCAGDAITLTAPVANTYLWNPGGATTQAINANPTTTTNYDVTLGYGNYGCTNNISTSVTVNPVATANAGPDDATCGLTYAAFAANTPVVGTGAWSQVSGPGTSTFTNGSSPTSGVTVTANGIYVFRWTVTAGAPCPGTAQDDVQINFAGTPSTANAGTDKTACVNPGSVAMTATAPTVGTGAWTQVAGPVTANIISPSLTNTTITGLNTTGTYTFRWTVSNNPCPSNFDDVDVVVNNNPTTPTITGGGTFCPQGTTLAGPVDPNYTYQWGRSFLSAPFANMGTAQTQAVTVSGNYQLTVTNQFGCSANTTTVVNVADFVFNGSLDAGDAQQTGRLNRFAQISTCASPKACPNTFTTAGSRAYDSYTITNPRNVPVCATIGLNSGCGTAIFSVAYSGSFNPTSLCTNYLADPGSSPSASIFYEATIPANGTIVIVVHEVNPGQGCANYTLTVDVPREAAGITAAPSSSSCSGAPITLTASTANSYLWSPGGATTQSVVEGNVGTFNYGVTLGYGNNGCTASASQTVTIANPSVNPVPNQNVCNGSAVSVSFSGTDAASYNWTNTNTAIGLPASGSGDLNFTATNATGAPISGTITVTPVNGSCSGTPITFTITVANQPMITSVTEDSVCAPGGVVNLAAAGTGIINWFDALTGGTLLNTGTTYSPNITSTTTYYVESQVNTPTAQTVPMPAQSNTFPGNVRGYWFTAPTDFVITSLLVPTTASSGPQNIAVLKFDGNTPPPVFSATTNAFTTLFLSRQNPSIGKIPCNIQVRAGEVIGILGSRGGINTYAPGDYNTSIFGQAVQMQRLGMQFPLETVNPQNIWREFGATTSISRIEFEYTSVSCSSSPRVPVTGTVNPLPVATATPSSQTVCSGPITAIVLSSQLAGSTYAWTRDNTVNVTGISASGTGDISGTLTNNTTVPQTVTFTITPTSPEGCVGASITATVTVNAVPTIICPANITVSNAAGQCGNTVTYSPTITGIPVPTVTYSFTGATTASGSGDGSGSFFSVGITNVTITATNSCGTASCSFTVTVNDTENPVITCPAPVTVSCAAAVPAPNTASVTATDNCPGVVVTHIGDVISAQTCANRYTITRTYRATDAANNFSECTQIITVNDQTPPVITCPAPVTVSCAAAVPAPNISLVTATDNCAGVVTITHIGDVISAQTCANRYTITRTYRATDVCGNFAECTQIITVNDQTPPVITCPAPVTVSCAAAVPVPNISLVTATDNCAGVVTITHVSDVISAQTCANRYTVTRTYRATDVCGNSATCTQIITVNDQTPPVITCPAPVTVSCASAVPAPNIALVTATDNCAGTVTITHVGDVISNQTCPNRYTLTRTYRATDVCGNSSTCTQIITVNDQTAPVLTCPANITVTTPVGSCTAVVNFTPTATDNCGGAVTIVSTPASGFAFPLGTTTVNVTATDACGNSSSCSFTITVNDAQLPVITAQPQNKTVCAGSNATFSVAAITSPSPNGPIAYQWQQWNGTTWVNIAGATSSSYTVSSVTTAMNTNTFRVVLNGLCTVVNSNAATLFVNPLPAITLDAAATASIWPNQTTTITATATPAGGTFVWTWNGSPVSGVTGPVLGPISIDRLGDYKVTYTDQNGCVNTSSVISITPAPSDNNLWVYPNPNTGQFNVRYYNQNGEKATLRVYSAGGQVVFEQALSLGITYSNTVVNLNKVAAGVYVVKIVNSEGKELAARRIIVYHP